MKTIVNEKDVSERIKNVLYDYQQNKGVVEYSNLLGITPAALNNYQKGRLPQLEQLIKIRNNLNLPFGYLLSEIDVTDYKHDTDNTFGLSVECIRKLETFNSDELDFISKFIQYCPKELITMLSQYSRLPIIDNDIAKSYYTPKGVPLSLGEVASFRMECKYIKDYIMQGIETTLYSLKLPSDELYRVFNSDLKSIRDELSKKINDPKVYRQLIYYKSIYDKK